MPAEQFDAIVGGRRLTAPRTFLNVGGRSVRPDLLGMHSVPTFDKVSIVQLDRVSEHLVIIGGSYIGLDSAGIDTDARGNIAVDDRCRTSAYRGGAIGDCNGGGAFTHTSWNDHEIVVANLFDIDPRRIADRIPCCALFIDPALGRVGMSETEARKTGRRLLSAKMPMRRVGRAREAGETQGFMMVLVDADRQLMVGAAILGLNGDEVVHGLLNAMAAKLP